MARTVIREETDPTVVEDSTGMGLGLVVGLLVGLVVLVLAFLMFRGSGDSNNQEPVPGTGNNDGGVPSAPANPGENSEDQPSTAPSSAP
jgi:hypothetical protein